MSKQYLVVTTMSLTEISMLEEFIDAWSDIPSIRLVLLLEEGDVAARAKELDRVVSPGINIVEFSADRRRKKAPLLLDIWKVFNKYKGYEAYAYVNADIRPKSKVAPNQYLGVSAIQDLLKPKRIAFAKRRDFAGCEAECYIYEQGYDMFFVPCELLESVPRSVLTDWQIGQVGWDYALPLAICKDYCLGSTRIPLFHRIHPSGSSADWSVAMLEIVRYIDESWVRDLSMFKRQVFRVLTMPLVIDLIIGRSFIVFDIVQEPVRYFYSRLVFYGFISKFLKALDAA